MSMFNTQKLNDLILPNLNKNDIYYCQYIHQELCKTGPCENIFNPESKLCCKPFIWRIHASDNLHALPKHPNCDCDYQDVPIKPVGTISNRNDAPDVWLKLFGKLPDYYITKQEAEEIYGWKKGKNTIAGKAPGKMIGGDIYNNEGHRLPEKEGRIWFECDVDYIEGSRNDKRLFYSNDGLMFYSMDHGQTQFYWIK